jgi:hypothetical protein
MKQYVIDEIRPEDHHKIEQYLDASYGPVEMGGIYWVPIAAEVLNEVRTKNRIRCACIGYASGDQQIWIMEVVDAIFEKLDIAT